MSEQPGSEGSYRDAVKSFVRAVVDGQRAQRKMQEEHARALAAALRAIADELDQGDA